MKLNVYVLTYNRSTLLKETIESILQQTYQDFDLYILDNCSTDDTGSVVQALFQPRATRSLGRTGQRVLQTGRVHAGLRG